MQRLRELLVTSTGGRSVGYILFINNIRYGDHLLCVSADSPVVILRRLFAFELGLPFLHEGSHSLFLIFGSETEGEAL
jgi:hypothetical protein